MELYGWVHIYLMEKRKTKKGFTGTCATLHDAAAISMILNQVYRRKKSVLPANGVVTMDIKILLLSEHWLLVPLSKRMVVMVRVTHGLLIYSAVTLIPDSNDVRSMEAGRVTQKGWNAMLEWPQSAFLRLWLNSPTITGSQTAERRLLFQYRVGRNSQSWPIIHA